MNRRDFLRTLAAATCLAALPASVRAADTGPTTYLPAINVAARRPNIVLVMSDDQGWGDTGYNGHPVLQTPNLDAMAAESLRFDRFYAAAPVCSPTRGSVMTARHPTRYHCYSWSYPLPTQEITLATLLRDAGYATGHFGKWHLGGVHAESKSHPAAHGFDEFVSCYYHFDLDPELYRNGKLEQFQGEGSMVVVDEALDFIRRQAAAEQPFLAVVWFASSHEPHVASAEDRAPYADQPEELQHYYGEITAMDRAFGKLRDQLRTLGIQQDTLLWFCSDNGGLADFGENGGAGAKAKLYEGGLRVPALLEWPAVIKEARSTSSPVVTADIMPTVLEAVGVQPPLDRPLDGLSIHPVLADRPFDRPPIGFWYYYNGPDDPAREDYPTPDTYSTETGWAAWLDWPWKLHKRRKTEDEPVQFALYNLADDPYETTDRAADEAARFADLRGALETWQASVVQSMQGEESIAA